MSPKSAADPRHHRHTARWDHLLPAPHGQLLRPHQRPDLWRPRRSRSHSDRAGPSAVTTTGIGPGCARWRLRSARLLAVHQGRRDRHHERWWLWAERDGLAGIAGEAVVGRYRCDDGRRDSRGIGQMMFFRSGRCCASSAPIPVWW